MEVDEARRLRGLEEENGRLRRLVADQAVQIQILKEVNAKNGKPVEPAPGSEDGRWKKAWPAQPEPVGLLVLGSSRPTASFRPNLQKESQTAKT